MKKDNKNIAGNTKKSNSLYERKWGNQYSLKYTSEIIESLADELLQWMESSESNLFFNKFFASKKVSRKVIKGFCEKNEYFAYIYDICKMIQEERLFIQGSTAKNPAMYIIALKNNHGWTDKKQVETTINDRVTGFQLLPAIEKSQN